ncbi:MAG: hypothetical protein U0637_15360 [Phycisphaerales bacterium]
MSMTVSPGSMTSPTSPAGARARGGVARWFSTFAAVLMLACVMVGFERFYLHGRSFPDREVTAPIRGLVITHGVVMMLWILLFIAQPVLAATRNLRVHMAAGKFGVVLAGAVLVLGLMIGVQSARFTPPDAFIMGFTPAQFMAVPVLSVVFFAVMVGAGVWQRKKPGAHRALMLGATLGVISAALNRIPALNDLSMGTVWDRVFGPFFAAVVLGVVLLAVRCVLIRSLDRWLAVSVLAVTVWSAVIVVVAKSGPWGALAAAVVG